MFLSVLVDEKDRDALRFLWYEDGDYKKGKIEARRWTKYCFGLSNSPFGSSTALNRTAVENEPQADQEVLLRSHY